MCNHFHFCYDAVLFYSTYSMSVAVSSMLVAGWLVPTVGSGSSVHVPESGIKINKKYQNVT